MCNKEHEKARKVMKRKKKRMQGLTVVFWVMTPRILVGRYISDEHVTSIFRKTTL